MNRTVTFELTDDLFLRSYRHIFGSKNTRNLLLAYALLGGLAIALGFALGGNAGSTTTIVVVIVGLLFGAYYYFTLAHNKNAYLAALAKLPDKKQSFTFTDDHVLVEGAIGQSNLTWDMLEKVECFRDLWHLHFLSAYYVLPSELIGQDLASFIESRALERGIHIFRQPSSLAREKEMATSNRNRGLMLLWLLLFAVFGIAGYAWYSSPVNPKANSFEERFVIESGNGKAIPVKIQNGEMIEISVTVNSGSPVTIIVGKDADFSDKKIVINSAGVIEAENVQSFRRKVRWPHSNPAIIAIMSNDKSDVSLKVEISRGK